MDFEEKSDLVAYLEKELGPELERLPEVRRGMVGQIARLFEVEVTSPPLSDGFALVVPEYRWVIRDDDLKPLDALLTALKAAAGVGFFTAGITGTPLVGAGAGIGAVVVALYSQAAKKSATVDPFELRLLIMLKANPEGLSTDDIIKILRRSQDTIGEATVTATLTGLSKRAVRDGSTVSFVSQDAKLVWRAAGV